MPLLDLVILALIQGVAEFLPISSSAHLILFPALTGEADQGLAIDAAVHVGTLAAVMLFFRSETIRLFRGAFALLRGRIRDEDARLVLMLALATIPVVIVGAAIAITGSDAALRSVALIAWTTIIFAVVLWLADRFGGQGRIFGGWRVPGAVAMGLAQAISIIPGVSRSGITMSAARAMGYGRLEAARLSLVMSIPATMAVGGYLAVKLIRSGDASLGLDALAAAVLAFFSALLALAFLMRMLRGWSMTPFVLYRLALGAFLLWFAYA
ncbi:MAG: undecaprenyl-diphosphate phosphatase [Alphaproteobacteria bacterium HGW-Alphaproteobacteria-8]|jgi:undecaprenyl-diphosphatase|nr:MAG: undecaprenyl-diphosphate phosphatase [Alphaproteobacteria bacterium HGW-Alphaproteobacteria-8]